MGYFDAAFGVKLEVFDEVVSVGLLPVTGSAARTGDLDMVSVRSMAERQG